MGNPVFWAIIIGWIMSVCVHEYCHALVAYLAGDRSVARRGYLSMNPLLYIDPVTSILIPVLALAMGGIPLPGGAVLIDRSALRKRWYGSLVSLAGPASNFLLFLLCAGFIHPDVGLVDWKQDVTDWPTWAIFAATMGVLQLIAMQINLLPIPPLDGFQIIEPYLSPQSRAQLVSPRATIMGFAAVYFGLQYIPGLQRCMISITTAIFAFVGVPPGHAFECYVQTFR